MSTILLFALAMAMAVAAGSEHHHHSVRLSYGDVVGQRVVQWTSMQKEPATVKWGTSESDLGKVAVASVEALEDGKSWTQTATLKSLRPGQMYYYSCGSDDSSWMRIISFLVSEHAEESVTFYTFGDMGVHFENSNSVLQALTKEPLHAADFVFHAGDMAYAFKNFTRWEVFLKRLHPISSRIPYLICTGNRDDVPDVNKRFQMPMRLDSGAKRNLYFSFEQGLVFGIAVAVGGQIPFDEASDQIQWLKKELARANSLRESISSPISWIVVWAHTPMYSSSDGHAGGNKEMRIVMERLFVEFNVALVVAGDDHVYERSFPRFEDSVSIPPPDQVVGSDTLIVDAKYPISFTVGTGGIDLDGWKSVSERPIWSAHRDLAHGFLKVVATPSMLTTSFVRASDSKVLDVMHLQLSAQHVSVGKKIRHRSAKGSSWYPSILVVGGICFGLWYFFGRRRGPAERPNLFK